MYCMLKSFAVLFSMDRTLYAILATIYLFHDDAMGNGCFSKTLLRKLTRTVW